MKTIRRLALPLVLLVLLCAALCCTAYAYDYGGVGYYDIRFTTQYPKQLHFFYSEKEGWDENALGEWNYPFTYNSSSFIEQGRDKSLLFVFEVGSDGYIRGSIDGTVTVTNVITGENVPVTGWILSVSTKLEHPFFNTFETSEWTVSGTGATIHAEKVFTDLPYTGGAVVPFSKLDAGMTPKTYPSKYTPIFDLQLMLADGNSCRVYRTSSKGNSNVGNLIVTVDDLCDGYYVGSYGAHAFCTYLPPAKEYHFAIEKTVTNAPEDFEKDVLFEYTFDGERWFPAAVHVKGSGTFTKEITYTGIARLNVKVREITALNDSGSNVTITGSSDTYSAYQIVTGDFYDEDGDGIGVLTNLQWGNGITDEGKTALAGGTDKAALDTFARSIENYTDDQVRDLAEKLVNNGWLTDIFAVSKDGGFSGMAQGWYLIKTVSSSENCSDAWSWTPMNTTASCNSIASTTVLSNEQIARFENVYNAESTTTSTGVTQFMLQVIGEDVDIEAKVPTSPESEKQVWENSTNLWLDAADAQMGVDVPFRLTAKLPTTYEKFHFYHLVMEDTLPAGMDYTGITKVYYTNDEGETTTALAQDEYSVDYQNHVLKIDFSKLKENENLTNSTWLVVEYTAVLNDAAVINVPGNVNSLVLHYTNDPNYKGEGEEPTGSTTPDDAVVYTYALALYKVDENEELLSGAVFALKNQSGETIRVAKDAETGCYMVTADGAETFTTDGTVLYIKGLDAGSYTLTEIKAPDGYNLAQPVTVNLSMASSATLEEDAAIAAYPVTVLDESGTVLPSTGGPGTAMFTAAGMTLMLTAACLLKRKRKMA